MGGERCEVPLCMHRHDTYFGIIEIMKKLLKSHSGKPPRFSEIVAKAPDRLLAFFEKFGEARQQLSLMSKVDVLNAVAQEEYENCAPRGGTVLMKWFEIFRDIYILRRQGEGRAEDAVRKDPNNFTTFARTFEPLAFLPDFWFAAERNVRAADERGSAHGLRLAFERYLYEREGGGVWGAMDWEMNRFLQRRIYETLESDEAGALRRIAALALTARAVAAGEMGLYVEERDDVTLPLSGISNVWNDPKKRNSLLKYYHYDRFTQLSFAREHEFAMDPNVPGTHVQFERQWMALAVISDVILKESDAHSTQAAATRVMLESVAQCMLKIKSKLLKKTSHRAVRKAAEKLYDFAVQHPDAFAKLTETELLRELGVKDRPTAANAYLAKCGFANADDFWDKVMPIFDELLAAFECNSDRVVAKYTEEQRRGAYRDAASSVEFVRNAIAKGSMSELPGAVGLKGVRDALKTLMLDGAITLQYATLDEVLTGGAKPLKRRVRVWSDERRIVRELPDRFPFATTETAAFCDWVRGYLSELSAQCAARTNQMREEDRARWLTEWRKSHRADERPLRDPFPAVKPLDYRTVDFAAVVAAADELWNAYFAEDGLCVDRWIVSVDRVLKVMQDPDVKRHGACIFNKTFKWIFKPFERQGLWERLMREKRRFEREGRWPDDIEKLKERLRAQPRPTIDEILSGESRALAMIAVLARLMVQTAVTHASLWEQEADLMAFYMHILTAFNRDFDTPFPWHLDVASAGSYFRTGRTHARQTNNVDDFIRGRFYDESERTAFIVFVAHYLAQRNDAICILDALDGNPSMTQFFADGDVSLARCRLAILRECFA